jgi:hypothetical protein
MIKFVSELQLNRCRACIAHLVKTISINALNFDSLGLEPNRPWGVRVRVFNATFNNISVRNHWKYSALFGITKKKTSSIMPLIFFR